MLSPFNLFICNIHLYNLLYILLSIVIYSDSDRVLKVVEQLEYEHKINSFSRFFSQLDLDFFSVRLVLNIRNEISMRLRPGLQ